MKSTLNYSFHCFVLLAIVFLPANWYIFSFQDDFAVKVFGPVVNWLIGDHLGFASDSAGLYALVAVLAAMALLLGLIGKAFTIKPNIQTAVFMWIRTMAVYYLSARLLTYGFDKIFQAQFYWPEPNTLYTPMGLLSKDILFWSTIGTSYWYSLLVGVAEVIPGLLLLWRRTRVLGLLLALTALTQVLFINIGFDISVKLYAAFLIVLTLFLLGPFLQTLFAFFLQHKAVSLTQAPSPLRNNLPWRKSLKVFFIGLLLIEAFQYPIETGYWNDNNLPKNTFHGAYQIAQPALPFVIDDTLVATPVRFFIHRRHFFIVQYANGQLRDYALQVDTVQHLFKLTSLQGQKVALGYHWQESDSVLTLSNANEGHSFLWQGHTLDWRKLPALEDQFHWTIDEL